MTQNLLESLTLSSRDEVSKWIERFEALCLLVDYQEQKKVSALITYMGPVDYETLHAALSPEHPEDKTYVELREILLKQLKPKRLIMVARYEFSTARQKDGETAKHLERSLADECQFANN